MIFQCLSRYKPLLDEIDYFISKGEDWDLLSFSEKKSLVAHCMRCPQIDPQCVITESSKIDDIVAITLMVLDEKDFCNEDIADTMSFAVINYFEEALIELFREQKEITEWDLKLENGLVPFVNQQTGETEWRSRA